MASGFPTWIATVADWERDVIYLLDAELRFVDCNPAWDNFAAANGGGPAVSRAAVLGTSVLDCVPDVLRTFYVHKFWTAMRTPEPTRFDYHCSSPEKIRLFRMMMRGLDEGLLVVNTLRLEEDCEIPRRRPRPPGPSTTRRRVS